jgi:hypothetical protein
MKCYISDCNNKAEYCFVSKKGNIQKPKYCYYDALKVQHYGAFKQCKIEKITKNCKCECHTKGRLVNRVSIQCPYCSCLYNNKGELRL